MSEETPTTTRRTVLKATSAAVVTSGLSSVASAVTAPSDVSADLISYTESSGFDNSYYDHALVRVYQADGATNNEVQYVAYDIAEMLGNVSTLDAHRVEAYSTNITGFGDCMNTDGCNAYQTARDYVVELGHYTDGGGNILIHDGDGGGTFTGTDHDNYITMDYYNTNNKAPISVKTPKTLNGTDGDVYWGAAHEIAHQLHGDSATWSNDYGTADCSDDGTRKAHYLATVWDTNEVSVMSAPDRGGHWKCGDCNGGYWDLYASLRTSDCFDWATYDALDYARTEL